METMFYGGVPEAGLRSGFLGDAPPQVIGPSNPIFNRFMQADMPGLPKNLARAIKEIRRGSFNGDVSQVLVQLANAQREFVRGITSQTTAFPVRENLEAEAKLLVPLDTPVRNMLPRTPGSGLSSKWKQASSMGGGYSAATTLTSLTTAGGATSIAVASSVGFSVNDEVYIGTGAALENVLISAIVDTTHITVVTTQNHANTDPVVKVNIEPGGTTPIQSFYSETGAPAAHTTVYVDQNVSYKLLGTYGSVTGLAIAGGANFMQQLAVEKTNQIRNLMLNEENAILNGNSASIQAPWGDGSNSYSYQGMIQSIATGNGTPATQIQTNVGGLTTAFLDKMLIQLWVQGAMGQYMILNGQEAVSLVHLAEASGTLARIIVTGSNDLVLGVRVNGYKHPISGEILPLYVSRFQPAGTIVFGCKYLPDGSPAADVQVLPQVQLPQDAYADNIQGYVARDLAPTTAAPDVYPFLVSVYSVFRMKSAAHFAKATGVTAV
jgi:hypothetical protein